MQNQEREGILIEQNPKLGELCQFIMLMIEPHTWDMNGEGGRGWILHRDTKLFVYNTIEVHQALGGLLREAKID